MPPCLTQPGTAAGEVLNTRHGVLPAVIEAPMTSSEVLPAGISRPVTFWSACAAFQEATTALPHFPSSGLFEYQIWIGPVAASSDAEPPPPPPQPAATAAAATRKTPRTRVGDTFIVCLSFGGPRSSRGPRGGLARAARA